MDRITATRIGDSSAPGSGEILGKFDSGFTVRWRDICLCWTAKAVRSERYYWVRLRVLSLRRGLDFGYDSLHALHAGLGNGTPQAWMES
jgi:hypothetical protein